MNKLYTDLMNDIIDNNNIVILRHRKPDGDCLGSQFGLKHFILDNFPNKNVMALSNDINDISKIDIGNFFPKIDNPSEIDFQNTLCIIVDTSSIERIAYDTSLLTKYKKVIKIDHHPLLAKFENYSIQSVKYSSTCEIISEFIFFNSKYKLSDEVATYLFIGMVTDTNRFLFNSTTSNTLLMASKLKEKNIPTDDIFKVLQYAPLNVVRFRSHISKTMKIVKRTSYKIVSPREYKKYGLDYDQASTMVNTLQQSNEILYSLYAIWNSDENCYKISLRSKVKPINVIAEKFGGGGHAHASGVAIKTKKELKEAIAMLIDLDETI